MPPAPKSASPGRIILAVLLPAASALALVPLRDVLVPGNLALLLVPAVLVAGAIGGRAGGVGGAVAGSLCYDVLLTRPFGSLRIEQKQDLVTTLLLGVIGASGGVLVQRLRHHAARAADARRALDRLERVTELVSGAESPARQVRLAVEELTALLDLKACRFQPGEWAADDVVLEHGRLRVPGVRSSSSVGRAVLPVRREGRVIGHFVLSFPSPAVGLDQPAEVRRAAAAVADAFGTAYGATSSR